MKKLLISFLALVMVFAMMCGSALAFTFSAPAKLLMDNNKKLYYYL